MRHSDLVVLFCILILPLFPFQDKLFSQDLTDLEQEYFEILETIGQDNYTSAIPDLKKLIEENPDFSKTYRSLVEAFIFEDRLVEAEEYFGELSKKHPENAYTYYCLARIDMVKQNHDAAITNLQTCISLSPAYDDAYSHNGGLPEVYKAKNDLESGIRYFQNLIETSPAKANACYGLARCYIRQTDFDKAMPMLNRAIVLRPDFTLAYHSIIFVTARSGKYDDVIFHSQKLLDLSGQSNDFEMAAYAAMMVGNMYYFQGDYSNALSYLNQSLKIAQQYGFKSRESNCLNTMAAIYAMTANFPKALQYFNQALLLAQKSGNVYRELYALMNIGNVYKDQGNTESASQTYRTALQIAKNNGFLYEESLVLTNMAESFQKAGDLTKGLAYQKQALNIASKMDDDAHIGFIHKNLGKVYRDLNKFDLAIQHLGKAHEFAAKTKDTQILWEAEAGLGSCYQKQGDRAAAIRHYANAIAIYDSVRSMLDIESLQNNFLEDKYQAYPSIIKLLAFHGQTEKAFEYSEKYKAKTLLDIVSRGKNLFGSLLTDSLKNELQRITEEHEATHRQLSIEQSKSDPDKDRLLTLDQKITDLELKRAALFNSLKNKHEDYFRLTSPDVIDLKTLQTRILHPDQALLEYVVGTNGISVFIITDSSFEFREIVLPREKLISMLGKLSPIFNTEERNALEETSVFNPGLTNFSITPAYELYEAILKPVEESIATKKILTIVPDDILFYLPFEILVHDKQHIETEYDFGNARFLIEKYAISYAASGSLLNPDLQKSQSPSKGILAFGNPDFERTTSDALFAAKNVVNVNRDNYLQDLPNTEIEVKSIARVLKQHENKVFIAAKATEENFKKNAGDFSVIHLATHFITNDAQPLYSRIALAHSGDKKEDGYLQTYEIFNLNLNANLAVLSACNTGLGQLRKGEGLIGISRAFLFAGVPSMVVSLWNVDDQSTSVIMGSFYKYLETGLDKVLALQKAKVDYLKSSPHFAKDPFYWAPFILMGESGPVKLPEPSGITFNIVLGMMCTLFLLGVFRFYFRRKLKIQ